MALIPSKRVSSPETYFLQKEDLISLFRGLPSPSRDRTLLLFLYNTGARVQEVAELRVSNLQLKAPARVQLHGKGDKWRTCPLWPETAEQLQLLIQRKSQPPDSNLPVFTSRSGTPLTRFGLYKIVRRHCSHLDATIAKSKHVSPHLFRHTAAVHLLESGVEVNVIRGWLGHVDLTTTNRYAEITAKLKEAALRVCELPLDTAKEARSKPVWKDDENLLKWLQSL